MLCRKTKAINNASIDQDTRDFSWSCDDLHAYFGVPLMYKVGLVFHLTVYTAYPNVLLGVSCYCFLLYVEITAHLFVTP